MRAKLTIGAEGQIAVPPREAEALGVATGGEVEVVSASGVFALLVPAGASAPRAYFAGSLASLTVAEVVQFVFSSLKTGTLHLALAPVAGREGRAGEPEQPRRKSIHFRDGQVVFASSSDPDDRLGPVLLRTGVVGAEDLERCANLVWSGRPLGQALVDEGVVTSGQLYEAITVQVKELFLSVFAETAGEFAFVEGELDETSEVKLPDRTRELVLEGMKRVEEAEQRRATEGAPPSEPEVAIEIEAPDVIPLPMPEVAIEIEPPAVPPPPMPGQQPRAKPPRSTGPFETYRRIFKRVASALAAVEPDAVERLNSWFDRLPEGRRAVFEGVRLGEDADMDVAQVLVNVESSGTYKGAAARARSLEALEEFLAFALFEVKNRLPRADAEKLLREVGRMQVGKA